MRKLFRFLRITILLAILIGVAADAMLSRLRTTDWDDTLWVALYPVNGEGDGAIDDYINGLAAADFAPMEDFFREEARGWGVGLRDPLRVVVAPPVAERPPIPPVDGNALENIWWSLRFRFWAWRMATDTGVIPHIRVFVVYHTPRRGRRLDHSVGLQKGLLGIANVFASRRMARSNQVVIAHEILHTLGATDKYSPSGWPIYPEGYAEPSREPRHPQRFAEIMAGRIPVSSGRTRIPPSLAYCVVGAQTAREINWLDEDE